MNKNFEIRNNDMPEEMRLLFEAYPRDGWTTHPNFAQATRNWLGAHKSFRKLSRIITTETENYLNKSRDTQDYADRLSYYGRVFVGNLHVHHGWEDREYFPELSAVDPRFDRGLEILEKDHRALDELLDMFASRANRTLKLIQLDEMSARDEAGILLGNVETIAKLLDRHLGDEEELAVPIILHYKLRA